VAGEVCKWRVCKGTPINLGIYLSKKVPLILRKVLDNICNRIENSADDNKAAYYTFVRKNLISSLGQLGNNGPKIGIISQAEPIYNNYHRGFADS
jgi:hypothetical protein